MSWEQTHDPHAAAYVAVLLLDENQVDAAREYAAIKGRRVTFEYACIAGVNDRPDQADRG